jgi:tRNA-dihydrouridine synthase A
MKERFPLLFLLVVVVSSSGRRSSSSTSATVKIRRMSAGGVLGSLSPVVAATGFTALLVPVLVVVPCRSTRSGSATSIGTTAMRILSRRYQSNIFSQINPSEAATTATATIAPQLLYQKKREELRYSSKLSLAPMMDYTTRHFRYLMRLLTRHTLLYTEMVAANALCRCYDDYDKDEQSKYGERRFLLQHPDIGPSVLQLGGSDPNQLYRACQIISSTASTSTSSSYTAINLNCGCPSPKVADKGCFGAALMKQPQLVQELCTAMLEGGGKTFPITVKCRIGTQDTPTYVATTTTNDDDAIYAKLAHFIDTVSSNTIVTDFQIHSRIALLHPKVSPSQNRKIPPLQYHMVHRLVQDFPHLTFTLNGGIESLSQVQHQYQLCPNLHGVMVGRSMVAQPWHWSKADTLIYTTNHNNNHYQPQQQPDTTQNYSAVHTNKNNNRWDVLTNYASYATCEEDTYGLVVRPSLLKSLHGLFTGEPNARRFRIALNTIAQSKNTKISIGEQILNAAQECFTETVLFQPDGSKGDEAEGGSREGWTTATATTYDSNTDADGDNRKFFISSAIQEWQLIRKEEKEEEEEDDSTIVRSHQDNNVV